MLSSVHNLRKIEDNFSQIIGYSAVQWKSYFISQLHAMKIQ